ncbi:MAG: zf-HC2 domain-containing protein [Gemmatimonadetes bacterium]|nr:zf-HC2 domain-containing protein [Gemmatimonadota bacterium]
MIHSRLSCGETVRALWDYVDHALPGPMRDAVAAHLATCDNCAGHVAFAQRMLGAIATAPVEDQDVARLAERVRVALRTEAAAG